MARRHATTPGGRKWIAHLDNSSGRLGGDEFAVLLLDQQPVDVTARIIHNIAASIEQPIATEDCVCTVGASVGVARYPAQGVDLKTVLKCADEDMYLAKQQGRPTPIAAQRPEP